MLNVRDKKGNRFKLSDEIRFVEICAKDGSLAGIVFTDDSGNMKLFYPHDPEFKRYAATYGVKIAKTI